MIKAGIIGATGYAGGELVRLLLGHRDAKIVWYGSRSYIDKKYAEVYQNMFQLVEDVCRDDNMEQLADEVDVIFTATPQGLCASLVNEEILSKMKRELNNQRKSIKENPYFTSKHKLSWLAFRVSPSAFHRIYQAKLSWNEK